MNKYYAGTSYYDVDNIERQLMPDESIIWSGKPKKSAFIINSAVKMMPVALIWLAFDGFFILNFLGTGEQMGGMGIFLVVFFLFHLMPVWIWLKDVITANSRWKNTEYAVTDKRIVMRNGLIGYQYESIYYTDISHVSLRVGAIDRMLGVGDIAVVVDTNTGNNTKCPMILDIEDPQRVFAIVQRTVMDMQTDIHYPNALRPETNPGYRTQYRP